MSFRVPRTCTEATGERQESHALETFRNRPAYVLLGEPGAGKTTAFDMEAQACGGCRVPARDFVVLASKHEWRGKTLFIDGLDEMRAGSAEGRTALDAIRRRLDELGQPHFRLSCREADWLGASDSEDLRSVSADGQVSVLHLDDLNSDQVLAILAQDSRVGNAGDFVRHAEESGLAELLHNPIALALLVEATDGQDWPKSRAETYAMACRSLCQEHNRRHRDAHRNRKTSDDDLLRAAGQLFAVQLLAGLEGFALDADAADAQHVELAALGLEPTTALQQALRTRLFVAGSREVRRKPIHRSVAEYLGARYLAELIDRERHPLNRILALMTGEDGGVVSGLRGLHAWLAVHCVSARQELIDRDPLGVVLHGDALGFPQPDKLRLLHALQRESKRYPWFRYSNWTSSPFGALGTPDMAGVFREHLQSPARDDAHQSFLDCILDAIRHGQPMPELAEPLMAVVRDASYWPTIRADALRAHIQVAPGESTLLLALADDIRIAVVDDGNDELLGQLLHHLYPQHLPPSRLLDHLHVPKQTNLSGSYSWFWHDRVFAKSSDDDLPVLLEAFVRIKDRLVDGLDEFHLKRFAGELIARTLESRGDDFPTERLFDWLGAGLGKHNHRYLGHEHAARISVWLNEHPEHYRSLVRLCAQACKDAVEIRICMIRQRSRLYRATPPSDIAGWYLQEAEAAGNDDLSRYFFDQAIGGLLATHGYAAALLEQLAAWIEVRPRFQPWLEPWLRCDMEDWRREEAQFDRQRKAESTAKQAEWLAFFRDHLASIANGTAPSKVLHDLAMIHRGLYYEAHGDAPRDRLVNFLGNNAVLIDAAFAGFRRTLARGDLPTVAEIVALAVKNRHHFIRTPCLVGAEELYNEDPALVLAQPDEVLSRIVTFWLTDGVGDTPSWFALLVRERPKLVADALIAYAAAMLKAGKEHVNGLYPLAHDAAYQAVARDAVLPLLQAFPLKAKKTLHGSLDVLLKAALRHLDGKQALAIVDERLQLPSMSAAQRPLWLAAGLVLDPARYELRVKQYVGKRQAHAAVLVGFFDDRIGGWIPQTSLPETAIELLVELLGPNCTPKRSEGFHRVSAAMHTADLLRGLVNQLGGRPGCAARTTLERLRALPALSAWHGELRHALETQRVTRREATFSHPSAHAVVQSLANREPANAADLAALVLDHLRDIAYRLRHGDTNGYRSFWNGDKPALENDCRDRLLDLLRPRLALLGVEAQKEGYYAEEKRADIRASYTAGALNVPVEIKRDTNDSLWRAMHDQLMARYTPDPDAFGCGVYLVFWFGGKGVPMPPTGPRPKDVAELEKRLAGLLSDDERRLVSVCVLDCSLPKSA